MTKNYDHRQNRGARSSYRGPRKGRRTPKKAFLPLAAAGTGLLLLAAVSAVTVSHFKGKGASQTQESPAPDTEPALTAASVTVNGISLEGLNQDEVYEKIKELFPWSMKAAYGDEQLPVTDLLQPRLKKWAQQLCTSSQSGEITLTAADLVDDQPERWQDSGKSLRKTADWIILTKKKEALYSATAVPALRSTRNRWPRIFFQLSVKIVWTQ